LPEPRSGKFARGNAASDQGDEFARFPFLDGWLAAGVRRRRLQSSNLGNVAQNLVQSVAVDELHCVKIPALVLADAEDRYDIRVMQSGGRARLTVKSF
jgi:hypothetical protein